MPNLIVEKNLALVKRKRFSILALFLEGELPFSFKILFIASLISSLLTFLVAQVLVITEAPLWYGESELKLTGLEGKKLSSKNRLL